MDEEAVSRDHLIDDDDLFELTGLGPGDVGVVVSDEDEDEE